MSANADDLTLASEFPTATREAWLKLVDGVLKGAPRERLASKTADGVTIEPLYPRSGGAMPVAGRAAAASWQVMQRADHPDPAAANKQALVDLENGTRCRLDYESEFTPPRGRENQTRDGILTAYQAMFTGLQAATNTVGAE